MVCSIFSRIFLIEIWSKSKSPEKSAKATVHPVSCTNHIFRFWEQDESQKYTWWIGLMSESGSRVVLLVMYGGRYDFEVSLLLLKESI